MPERHPLSMRQRAVKRTFDLVVAGVMLTLTWWVIVVAVGCATVDTRQFGLFTQRRVGARGRLFRIYKLRTMRTRGGVTGTTVTTTQDVRITRLGRWLRRWKLDELPQLVNVLKGDMSLVGPRPDVPGFADRLEGTQRQVLAVRPGVTGPATVRFREEETILASVTDPEGYNREILYPAKVAINIDYVQNYSLWADIRCLVETVVGPAQGSRVA